ncbi:MAG: ATP-dependent helicase [Propionibacteriaceae bacterium]|jgi:DNA helicase-2/ATP-dependent DNA helicase PcrA|nr:ATP-dependent helicase [Propionibacteriaceae bacterium]
MTSRNQPPVLRGAEDLCAVLGLDLTDEQRSAATAPLAPGVIVAGAGTGKTTVMAARVVWLVGSGAVTPDQVLGLTFTRKAAHELADRVRSALSRAGFDGGDAASPVVSTYDAFAKSVVDEFGLYLGADPSRRLIADARRYQIVLDVLRAFDGRIEALADLTPATIAGRVLDLDSAMTSHRVTDARLLDDAASLLRRCQAAPLNRNGRIYASVAKAIEVVEQRRELLELRIAYRARKEELGVVEFADLMAEAATIAETVPVAGETLRERHRVVLLDEYQDTSTVQVDLLAALFGVAAGAGAAGFPVTAVGDPFQAIYGWRGAAADTIFAFEQAFPDTSQRSASCGSSIADRSQPRGEETTGVGGNRFGLTLNRRSGPEICAAANDIAAPLREAGAAAGAGPGQLLRTPPGTAPAEIETAGFLTWDDEIAWIGDSLETVAGQGASWGEIALLVRRNSEIAPLYDALTARGFPVEIVGLGGLLGVGIVAQIVTLLRLVEDPSDNTALVALLTGPRWRIGRRDLARLGRRAAELAGEGETVVLADALADPGSGPFSAEARRRFRACAEEIATISRWRARPADETVARIIARIGARIEVEVADDPAAARRQVEAFTSVVAAYTEADPTATVAGLVAYFDAEIAFGDGLDQGLRARPDAITLTTIHRSKGLEWPIVYLPGLISGAFPTDRMRDNPLRTPSALPTAVRGDALSLPQIGDVTDSSLASFADELKADLRRSEDRLAYVAVTRARRRIVATTHRWKPHLAKPAQPSPYYLVLAEAAGRLGTAGPVPEPGESNPQSVQEAARDWPIELDEATWRRRHAAADLVRSFLPTEESDAVAEPRELRDQGRAAPASGVETPQMAAVASTTDAALGSLSEEEAILVEHWDGLIVALERERRSHRGSTTTAPVPVALSTSRVMLGATDPDRLAQTLLRPLPAKPSRRSEAGQRFHQWAERHFHAPALVPLEPAWDPLPSGVDPELDGSDDALVAGLIERFTSGRFGAAIAAAVEWDFVAPIGSHVVSGRIDAVFRREDNEHIPGLIPGDADVLVVDWKTGKRPPDPFQLEIYRVAWAQAHEVPFERIAAGFHHVAEDRFEALERPASREKITAVVDSLGKTTTAVR